MVGKVFKQYESERGEKDNLLRFFQRISPFQAGVEETSLLSLRQSFRSSFFFNRSSPKFGMDLSFLTVIRSSY